MKSFGLAQRIELFSIAIKRRRLDRQYRPLLKSTDSPDFAKHYVEFSTKSENYRMRIAQIKSAQLVRKAVRLGLDLPHEDRYTVGYIKKPTATVQCAYLNPHELRKFRRQIRIEQRLTWEFWLKVIVPILTVITGLIGVAIGLVSVLKAK